MSKTKLKRKKTNFFIKRVTAKGEDKKDSTVEFYKGLNIIKGRSNTGKTVIVKCIDFCFGGDNPFDKSLGYTKVEMEVQTMKGSIVISRNLDSKVVDVKTNIPNAENGTYSIDINSTKHPLLSDLLLSSIGIKGDINIVKNKSYGKQRLTWRTFLHILLFTTESIVKTTSVILPQQATQKTSFLSALLFLLTGNDFNDNDTQEKKEIRDARKKAVEDYVNGQIQDISQKKKEIQEKLDSLKNKNTYDINSAIESLNTTEKQLSKVLEKRKSIIRKITDTEEEKAKCEMMINRYTSLGSQYISDIKRLSLIADGETKLKKVPVVERCPFCNGELPKNMEKSYIESARGELIKISLQLDGLSETKRDVQQEKEEIQTKLDQLKSELREVDENINRQLQPKASALKKSINEFRSYTRLQEQMQLIDELASNWNKDLRKIPEKEPSKTEYHPSEYFDSEFQKKIDDMLFGALTDCNYPNLTTAHFNLKSFDIEVNGHKKADANGQGYCCFLNSIIAVVFRAYIEHEAKYNPGFVIIDSPLLGLDQGVNDGDPESMKTALFNFFINHKNDGQIIIVENIEQMPDIDFAKEDVNVITFTGGKEKGRYGFLNDIN